MERPSNRSYALRGNRPTRAQALAMKTHWSNFSLQVESELEINDVFPDAKEVILEIGSGAGFLGEMSTRVITSEILYLQGIDIVVDGCDLPFTDCALAGIAMTDVLHHIPNVLLFFSEAARCVNVGGRLLMIEPWNTPWSQFIYRNFHSEPFEPKSDWIIPESGPLSAANGALPWIIFERDLDRFKRDFPQWRLNSIYPFMPFSYLLSGGVSLRSLMPVWTYPLWRRFEGMLNQRVWAMFAFIELERVE